MCDFRVKDYIDFNIFPEQTKKQMVWEWKKIWGGLKFHVQVLVDVDFADIDGKFCPLLA